MGGTFDKILKGAGIAVGAAALGGYLFPETMGSLTGGLFGSANPGAYGPGGSDLNMFGFNVGSTAAAGAGAAGGAAGGIFSNPTVLSSAILAGTSLLSGAFGSDLEQDKFDLAKQESEAAMQLARDKLQLDKDQLAQALEIAKIQAGAAGSAASAARDTQLRIARSNARQNMTGMKYNLRQAPILAREGQRDAATTTGVQSGNFFNTLIPNLQRGALTA